MCRRAGGYGRLGLETPSLESPKAQRREQRRDRVTGDIILLHGLLHAFFLSALVALTFFICFFRRIRGAIMPDTYVPADEASRLAHLPATPRTPATRTTAALWLPRPDCYNFAMPHQSCLQSCLQFCKQSRLSADR